MIKFFVEEGETQDKLDALCPGWAVFVQSCIDALFCDTPVEHSILFSMKDWLEGDVSGLCTGDEHQTDVSLSTTYHFSDGSELIYSEREIASTIAHELVHCRQFARGQINAYDYTWASSKGRNNYFGVSYEDCPWEVEANSLENVLTELFYVGD